LKIINEVSNRRNNHWKKNFAW